MKINENISIGDNPSDKEYQSLLNYRIDSVDKWALVGYRIDFVIRYILLAALIYFFCYQLVYVHHIILFQEKTDMSHRLGEVAFRSIIQMGFGITTFLVFIVGYWFGKNNSYSDYAKMVFERFKK